MTVPKLTITLFLAAAVVVGGCEGKLEATRTWGDPLRVERAWARTTPAGAKTGAGYLVITAAEADRLLAASSPVAERVTLHESTLDGAVMTMRHLPQAQLLPGQALVLAPGGKHLMFMGLKAPLTAGSRVPVTLSFEKAGERTIDLEVRDAAPPAP